MRTLWVMVHITQPEALEVLAMLEGERWKRTQEERQDVPYGFFFWLRAWRAKAAAGLSEAPVSLCQFAERATKAPILYGEEGYRKYHVDANGELTLMRDSLLPDFAEKATALGIRLS
jgi:hypothetical protein